MVIFKSFSRRSVRPLSRVVVSFGIEDERRASWPTTLPKQMCYGNIPPPNKWSSDQVPLQDRQTKRTVDIKGTKRMHVKTQKTDFELRFCTFQVTVRSKHPQTMPLMIIFKGKRSREKLHKILILVPKWV